VTLFGDSYRNRRVLVTGHTGFKGSWLTLWLESLGAQVAGIALPPETQPSHWHLLSLDVADHAQDIRDAVALKRLLRAIRPEIVFHLAAQPLVRRSYRDPLATWETNVMGTANLLDACRDVADLKAIVVVTSDKCYENREWLWGYRENDRLGGHDPYSASKAATELVAASYRKSFFLGAQGPLLATARAGNVVGGGDWSEDRLVPDLVRAIGAGESLEIRSPGATRPWQHVLESLSGYLLLGQRLLEGRAEFAEAWNFGPDLQGNRTVSDVLARLQGHWPQVHWHATAAPQPHEANLLQLDSTKARQKLGWQPHWDLQQTLKMTAIWYREYLEAGRVVSREQLAAFCANDVCQGP
jgi:CDP-glucose 4,6-dehydratase